MQDPLCPPHRPSLAPPVAPLNHSRFPVHTQHQSTHLDFSHPTEPAVPSYPTSIGRDSISQPHSTATSYSTHSHFPVNYSHSSSRIHHASSVSQDPISTFSSHRDAQSNPGSSISGGGSTDSTNPLAGTSSKTPHASVLQNAVTRESVGNNMTEQVYPGNNQVMRTLFGSTMSACFRLSNMDGQIGAYFLFPEICLRLEGIFRLRFTIFDILSCTLQSSQESIVSFLSTPFRSYNPRDFPGMQKSPPIIHHFFRQGAPVLVRSKAPSKKRAIGISQADQGQGTTSSHPTAVPANDGHLSSNESDIDEEAGRQHGKAAQ
ncbi:hypothetical protein BASA60_010912 [Batrachochytrium salamandrivorans]|nr:hypothetical protein BASA60_010912 [Batrachochytrium salamandrivorans]